MKTIRIVNTTGNSNDTKVFAGDIDVTKSLHLTSVEISISYNNKTKAVLTSEMIGFGVTLLPEDVQVTVNVPPPSVEYGIVSDRSIRGGPRIKRSKT